VRYCVYIFICTQKYLCVCVLMHVFVCYTDSARWLENCMREEMPDMSACTLLYRCVSVCLSVSDSLPLSFSHPVPLSQCDARWVVSMRFPLEM
jgi:hypothetical protein